MTKDVRHQLNTIRAVLMKQGHEIRDRCFFSDHGFMVCSGWLTADGPMAGCLTVYANRQDHLELRATWHGGPHWICQPGSVEQALAEVDRMCRGSDYPPTHWWVVDDFPEQEPLAGVTYAEFLESTRGEQLRFLEIARGVSDESEWRISRSPSNS